MFSRPRTSRPPRRPETPRLSKPANPTEVFRVTPPGGLRWLNVRRVCECVYYYDSLWAGVGLLYAELGPGEHSFSSRLVFFAEFSPLLLVLVFID